MSDGDATRTHRPGKHAALRVLDRSDQRTGQSTAPDDGTCIRHSTARATRSTGTSRRMTRLLSYRAPRGQPLACVTESTPGLSLVTVNLLLHRS